MEAVSTARPQGPVYIYYGQRSGPPTDPTRIMPILATLYASALTTLAFIEQALHEIPRSLRAQIAPQHRNLRRMSPGAPRAARRYRPVR